MRIDAFTHFYPAKYYQRMEEVGIGLKDMFRRARAVQSIHDLDTRLRVIGQFPDYAQILSLPTPPLEAWATAAKSRRPRPDRQRRHGGAGRQASRRFPGFVAAAPLNDPDAGVARSASARSTTSARAASRSSPTSAASRSPRRSSCRSSRRWPARPADLAASRTRGADVRRLPDRGEVAVRDLVDVRLALRDQRRDGAAGVRQACSTSSRTSRSSPTTWARWRRTSRGASVPAGTSSARARRTRTLSLVLKSLKKRPLDYFKMFYADTALFGARRARCAGSSSSASTTCCSPPTARSIPRRARYIRETIKILDGLELSKADRDKIYFGNLERLTGRKFVK